jgi:hypothetical protein
MIETYYFVGLREKEGEIIPVMDLIGNDAIPSPLFTTEDEAAKYRNRMSKLYPSLDYYCLKATILGMKEK